MNTTELANLYSAFYPPEFLNSKVEAAVKFLPEEVEHVVPSIQLGKDGITLSSLLLVTNKYVCEVRLSEGKSVCDFDYMAKNTIYNYRMRTWTHEIKEGEVVKASFEIAEVNMQHEGSGNLKTQLFFAGNAEGREAWLLDLTKAIPIEIVLEFSSQH